MMLVFSLIYISIILVQSRLKTDCYSSFSMPVIYIKLSHSYPSGPLYLKSIFKHARFSLLNNNIKWFSISYHFKRVDNKCTASVLFSSLGYDLKFLDVEISLYLNIEERIAFIHYCFYNGFTPGVYKMLDNTQHFLFHTKVIDDDKDYLNVSAIFLNDDVSIYLNSISVKNDRVCVITENNRAVVLELLNQPNTTYGYITGFMVEISRYGEYIGTHVYPAFGCNKDKTYYEYQAVFITDGNEFITDLYLLDITLKKTRFIMHNPNFEYVYNLQNIQKKYLKVFLMEERNELIICPDESLVRVYLSHNNIKYYARAFNNVYISPWVIFFPILYRSPFDECNKKIVN